MFSKLVILLFLAAIFSCLGSALYYLLRDPSGSKRVVKALTVRISLSLFLFILLMLGFYFGLLHPNATVFLTSPTAH